MNIPALKTLFHSLSSQSLPFHSPFGPVWVDVNVTMMRMTLCIRSSSTSVELARERDYVYDYVFLSAPVMSCTIFDVLLTGGVTLFCTLTDASLPVLGPGVKCVSCTFTKTFMLLSFSSRSVYVHEFASLSLSFYAPFWVLVFVPLFFFLFLSPQ